MMKKFNDADNLTKRGRGEMEGERRREGRGKKEEHMKFVSLFAYCSRLHTHIIATSKCTLWKISHEELESALSDVMIEVSDSMQRPSPRHLLLFSHLKREYLFEI